jgi:hypothetical protein
MMPSIRSGNSEIAAILDTVDWNFPRAGTWQNALHSLHWFPGNFIPQLPSYLVQSLSGHDATVFDPFCGSCTTAVEAIILGRPVKASDFSPVSYLISRAKLTLLTDRIAREELAGFEVPPLLRNSSIPDCSNNISELRLWFDSDTLAQLSHLWGAIQQYSKARIGGTLDMLFSDTLFACASTSRARTASGKQRRHHWGWVADNVLPKPPVWHDAVRYFEERIHRAKVITSGLPLYDARYEIRREDIRACSYESNSVDLVVTSPPYLGMIDYTTASRLTYLWFGWDLVKDRTLEIGARSRRNSPKAQPQYLTDMDAAVSQIYRVLKPGGACAVVIGASRKYPEMALKVIDVFKNRMAIVWGPKERVPTRRRVSDRKGSAPSEYICVLRKE